MRILSMLNISITRNKHSKIIDSIRAESLDHCFRPQTKSTVIPITYNTVVVTSVDWD